MARLSAAIGPNSSIHFHLNTVSRLSETSVLLLPIQQPHELVECCRAGGTQRLPRLIGRSKAKEMIFTGRFVGPEEALDIGMLSCFPFSLVLVLVLAWVLLSIPDAFSNSDACFGEVDGSLTCSSLNQQQNLLA